MRCGISTNWTNRPGWMDHKIFHTTTSDTKFMPEVASSSSVMVQILLHAHAHDLPCDLNQQTYRWLTGLWPAGIFRSAVVNRSVRHSCQVTIHMSWTCDMHEPIRAQGTRANDGTHTSLLSKANIVAFPSPERLQVLNQNTLRAHSLYCCIICSPDHAVNE